MGRLFRDIADAVRNGRYVIGQHANQRLRERRLTAWQIIDGAPSGILLSERTDTLPNPTVEVQQQLADGSNVKVVWALMKHGIAKLVTVHFFDDRI